jgi:hypothetical protein
MRYAVLKFTPGLVGRLSSLGGMSMKRFAAIVLLVACFAVSAAYSESFMNKFRFSLETLPDQDGGGLKGKVGFKFTDRFASMLYMKQLVTAETGILDLGEGVADSSLNLLRSSVTEYFIIPAEFSLAGIGEEGLTLGLGGYISTSGMKNVGYFRLTDTYIAALASSQSITMPKNNYYDNESSATFYGLVVTAEVGFDFGFVSIDPRIVVVPFFLFSETQSLEISPLLTAQGWDKDEISYDSKGFPYVALSMDDISFPIGNLLNVRGLSAGASVGWEMSRQSMQLITPVIVDGNKTMTGVSADVTNTTLSYQGRIGYTFTNGSSINIGFGQRQTWNAQKDGPTASSTKPIYSIKYNLRLGAN